MTIGLVGVILPSRRWTYFHIPEEHQPIADTLISKTRMVLGSADGEKAVVQSPTGRASPDDEPLLGPLSAGLVELVSMKRNEAVFFAMAIRKLYKADFFLIRGKNEQEGMQTTISLIEAKNADEALEKLQPEILVSQFFEAIEGLQTKSSSNPQE